MIHNPEHRVFYLILRESNVQVVLCKIIWIYPRQGKYMFNCVVTSLYVPQLDSNCTQTLKSYLLMGKKPQLEQSFFKAIVQ